MPTGSDLVCLSGKIGSHRRTAFPSGGASFSDGLLRRRRRSTPTNETERRTVGMSGSPADALEVGAITDTAPTLGSADPFCGSPKLG